MTTKNQNVRSATSRSAIAGLFGVAMVVIVTACSALFLGFGTPTAADAQFVPAPIVVTAPVITPTPVTPIILPVILPVFTPLPFVAPTAPSSPKPIVVTGTPTQSPAPSTPAPTVSTPTPTPTPIVVTGTRDNDPAPSVPDTITYTSPCCTLPSGPTTDTSTPQIVVNAPTPGVDTITYTSPCCTVPVTIAPVVPPPTPIIDIPVTVPPVIIPPVIVPPVIVPPVVVPPTIPVPQCTLIAGPTSVQVGGSSVLTWTTAQATSFSINQNIGVVTPVDGGTTTVTPGTTTTYTGTATGLGGTVTCNATVTVTTTPPVPACVLTASATSVAPGTEVTLAYSGTNIGSVSIDQGVGAQASTSGSVVVKPTADTTYTGTFTPTNGSEALTCTVPVTIITGGGGGGCTSNCGGGGGGGGTSSGGGGGGSSSHSSGTSLYSRAIEAPLGAVYLSQIPYTGLDLGTFGTFMYWFMLVLWSLAAAYLVLFGMLPFMRRRLSTFGANVRESINEAPVYVPEPIAHARPVAMPVVEHTVHQAVHAAAVTAATHRAYVAPAVSARTVRDGFKSFATEGALTIDDIVKGLSRESGMVFATSEPVQSNVEEHASHEAPVTIEREEVEAPVVATAQAPAYSAVKASAPRVETTPPAVAPEVPGFISAILAGERDEVFGIIRSMNQAGHDVEAFMAHAICALDDAYRARIDGTPVHADVKQVTDPLGTEFLEKLVTSLTTAVDGSYSMGVTGIKLALTRALAVAQG